MNNSHAQIVVQHPENLNRNQLVNRIIKQDHDPEAIDFWGIGLFREDPKNAECFERIFVAFGKLKDVAAALADCLSRKPNPSAARMRIIAHHGEVGAIDCHDFCF